jgi:hypothetical protein
VCSANCKVFKYGRWSGDIMIRTFERELSTHIYKTTVNKVYKTMNGTTVIKVIRLSYFSLEKPKCIFLTSRNNPYVNVINDEKILTILHLPIVVMPDEGHIKFSGWPG